MRKTFADKRPYGGVTPLRVLALMLACLLLVSALPAQSVALAVSNIASVPAAIAPAAQTFAPAELKYAGADYVVTTRFGADARIPAGARLKAEEILPGTPQYAELYAQLDGEADTARFFDIGFVYDGVEIEPAAPVDVEIQYAGDDYEEHLALFLAA